MMPFRNLMFFVVIFVTLSVASNNDLKSCLDYYFAGKTSTGIYNVTIDGKTTELECNMDRAGSNGTVETIVHNALEPLDRWTGSFKVKNGDKPVSIGYQISLTALKELSSDNSCHQRIKCSGVVNINSITSGVVEVEDMKGGKFDLADVCKGKELAFPIIAIIPKEIKETEENKENKYKQNAQKSTKPTEFNITVSLGPLKCSTNFLEDEDCSFSILQDDRIELNVHGDTMTLNFLFRTNAWNTRLINLKNENDEIGNVAIEKGYILKMNSETVFDDRGNRLLRGQDWHRVKMLLSPSSFQIFIDDNVEPLLISFDGVVKWIEIPGDFPHHGALREKAELQVTNIKMGQSSSSSIDSVCRASKHIKNIKQKDRKIGPNFCSGCICQIPKTIAGFSNPKGCDMTDENNFKKSAFLTPNGDNNPSSFLRVIYNKQPLKMPKNIPNTVSFMFRTTQSEGWLFSTRAGTKADMPYLQMTYQNSILTAIHCHHIKNFDEQEKCQRCSIKRENGFDRNEWIQVAYIIENNYTVLVVDGKSCGLKKQTLKGHYIDNRRLLEHIPVAYFGGLPLEKQVTPPFYKNNLQTETKGQQAVPMNQLQFKGCIANIAINSKKMSLDTIKTDSKYVFSYPEDKNQIGDCPSCTKNPKCLLYDCSRKLMITKDGKCTSTKPNQCLYLCQRKRTDPITIRIADLLGKTQADIKRIWLSFRLAKLQTRLCFITIKSQLSDTPLVSICQEPGTKSFRVEVAVLTENHAENAQKRLFTVNSLNDSRSLTLLIEQSEPKSITIQLNNVKKTVQHVELELAKSIEFQKSKADSTNKIDWGCLVEFAIDFKDYNVYNVLEKLHQKSTSEKPGNKACGTVDRYLLTYQPNSYGSVLIRKPQDGTTNGDGDDEAHNTGMIFIYVICATLLLAILIGLGLFAWKKRKSKSQNFQRSPPDSGIEENSHQNDEEPLRNGNRSDVPPVQFLKPKDEEDPEIRWTPEASEPLQKYLDGNKKIRPSSRMKRPQMINRLSEFYEYDSDR